MYLLPLNDNFIHTAITLNSTQLADHYIIDFTYHSKYSNLIYILYGSDYNPATPLTPYQYYRVQTWNTDSQTVISNFTDVAASCYIRCIIKATQDLFLLESPERVVLYRMMSDKITISNVKVINLKVAQPLTDNYVRKHADIFKNYYVFSNQSYIYLQKYDTSSTYSIQFGLPSPLVTLQVGITDAYLFLSYEKGSVYTYIQRCVQCLFNYTYTSGSTLVFNSSNSVNFSTISPNYYKMDIGDPQLVPNNTLISFNRIDANTLKLKIIAFNLSYIALQSASATTFPKFTSNTKVAICYGSFDNLQLFQLTESTTNISLSTTLGNIIKIASISNDSSRIIVKSDDDSTHIKQYQLVSNCSNYNAVQNGTQCQCNSYSGAYCQSNYVESTTTTTSFPIYAAIIIAVVAVVIISLISYLLYRKFIKKGAKNPRTPWKYNPVELMSFQY